MKQNLFASLGTDFAKDKQIIKKIMSNASVFVGWVDSYNDDNKTVNVQPAIQRENVDENSVGDYVNRPYLNNVWVVVNTLGRNPQRGDKALVLVLDEKSNTFFKTDYDNTKTLQEQTFVNSSKSIKTLSNCVAIIVNPTMDIQGITSIDGLAGGTLTSPLNIQGGDSTTASKISLNRAKAGQITDETTATLFGWLSNNATTLTVGSNTYSLNLRGNTTRPTYKGNDMALYSDIPTVPTSDVNSTPNTLVMRDASGDTYARYVYGTWLKSTGSYDIGSSNWSAVWVDDGNGWLYKRTKSNFIGDLALATNYPVGSIYISVENTSPASIFGGSWTALTEGYVLQTTTTANTGGDTIAAGLPNITGDIFGRPHAYASSGYGGALVGGNGAFSLSIHGGTATHAGAAESENDSIEDKVSFDASQSNSIYGNSTTVQPPAIKVYMWKRVS